MLATALLVLLLDMAVTSGVAVVFGLRTVGDNEDLHILIERASCPEGFPAIAVDLVEGFLEAHTSALQLDMYQWQAVHKDGHVVAVRAFAIVHLVLVDYLGGVVVNVLCVDEVDVFLLAAVKGETLHVVTLNGLGFLRDALALVGDFGLEESLPLVVGEDKIIEFLQLPSEIANQFVLMMNVRILVALTL